MRFRLVVDGEVHDVEVEGSSGKFFVRIDGAVYRAAVLPSAGGADVRVGRGRHRVDFHPGGAVLDGRRHRVLVEREASPEGSDERSVAVGRGQVIEIRPPMPGRIVRIAVEAGASVRKGQAIAVLEAMKMQNEIHSSADGIVRALHVKEGDSISADRIIASIETS